MSDLPSARSLIATARYHLGNGIAVRPEPFIDLAERLAGVLDDVLSLHTSRDHVFAGVFCAADDREWPCPTIVAAGAGDGAT